jgi:TnpA family transposase
MVSGTVNPHKGSEPAISIYTHLSSRFAPYSAKTISATEGEAPFMLDGLINADAPIGIASHHTDGGGVSGHVFGLCPMFGFRFAPRIPNFNDRRLYSFDPAAQAGTLAPFIGGRIDEGLILAYWDEILRLATSIRTGHVSASLMLKRLGSYPR